MKNSALFLCICLALGACQSPRKPKQDRPPEVKRNQRTFKTTHKSALTPEQRKLVVAKVGKKEITLGDLEQHLNRQPLYIRARYTSLKQRKQLLRDLAQFEALAMEAKLKGYDQHPEVLQYQKRLMVSKLLQNELRDKLKISDISDEDAKKYYDEHKAEFNREARVRISVIVLATKEEADKVLAEIKTDVGKYRYRTARTFGKAARKYSIDKKSKVKSGDVGYYTVAGPVSGNTFTLDKTLLAEAFKLTRVYDMAGPVKTDKGWNLLMLSHLQPKISRPFASVKRYIQSRLFRQKRLDLRKTYIDDLKKAAKIEIIDSSLNLLKTPDVKSFNPGMHRLRHPGRHPHKEHK